MTFIQLNYTLNHDISINKAQFSILHIDIYL